MTENNDKSSDFSSISDELELELRQSIQNKNQAPAKPRPKREPFVSIAEVTAKLPPKNRAPQPDFIDMLGEPEVPAEAPASKPNPAPRPVKPKTPMPNVETTNFYDDYVEEIDDIVGPPKPPPPPITQTRQWDSAAALQELLEQHDKTTEKLARKARESIMRERMKELTGEDFSQIGDEANMQGLNANSLRPDMPGGHNSRYFTQPPRKWYDFSLLAKLNIAALIALLLAGLYYLSSFHPFAPEIIYADETAYKAKARIEDLAPKPELDAASLLQKHPEPPIQKQPLVTSEQQPIAAPKIVPKEAKAQPTIPQALLQNEAKPEAAAIVQTPAPTIPAPAAPVAAPAPVPVPAKEIIATPKPEPKPIKTQPVPAEHAKPKPEIKHKPIPKPVEKPQKLHHTEAANVNIAKKPAPKPLPNHDKHAHMAYYVQLASTPSASAAEKLLAKQNAHLQTVLKNYALNVEKTIIPSKGVYYRLRINVKDAEEAKKLCFNIRQHGGQCIFGIR